MIVKKFGSKVIGAQLTNNEKKALQIEARNILAEETRKHKIETAAMVLWVLHETEGSGPKKLRRFFDNFDPAIEDLVRRYQLEDDDDAWLCTRMLKEYGIDIEKWYDEKGGDKNAR